MTVHPDPRQHMRAFLATAVAVGSELRQDTVKRTMTGGVMFRDLLLLSVLLGMHALAGPTSASAQACRTASDTAGSFESQLKSLYTEADSASLVAQGHPYARPTAIALVTDTLVCAAAVTAYNTRPGGSISSAFVYRLGTSGYAVVEPMNKAGEWTMMHIYNASWAFKLSVGG